MPFEAEQLRISVKSQQNRAGVLSASSSIAWVPDRLPCVTLPCCSSQQPRHDSEFHSCRQCWGQTVPRSEAQLSVNCSTVWAELGCPLSFTFLEIVHHPPHLWKWEMFSQRLEKQKWWNAWKATMSQHCWKWNRGRYWLHLLLPRRLTSDPGNRDVKWRFWCGGLLRYFNRCSTWNVPVQVQRLANLLLTMLIFLKTYCASVLWIFNLSALFNLERFLNVFSCLHSLHRQFALLLPLI